MNSERGAEPNGAERLFWMEQVSHAAAALKNAQDAAKPKRWLGSISDLSSVRDMSFSAGDSHAPSRVGSRSKATLIGSLVCLLVAGSLTGVITVGEFTLGDIWRELAIDRTFALASWSASPAHETAVSSEPSRTLRLVVQRVRGTSAQPAPLGLTVEGGVEGAVVHIKGLVPGMELSAGNAVGPDAWEIPVSELDNAWIAPPEGFFGSADLVAKLRLPDNKIADRQTIALEWGSPSPRSLESTVIAVPPPAQLNREEVAVVPVILRQFDREGIAVLLKRGKDLIAAGDLAAARLVLQRAADANDLEATLALAATYDPHVLKELKVYGLGADVGMAGAWYEKARQLGSSAASRRLEMLSSGPR